MNLFFDNLENLLKKHPEFGDGSRIYNLDETATKTVQAPKCVIAQKGIKQLSKCTSGERGVLVTTCAIINASGTFLPPVMVFPRRNYKAHMLNGAPPGTLGMANPSGWMIADIFENVLLHFVKYSSSSIQNPTFTYF